MKKLLVLALLFNVSCGNDKLPEYYRLDRLRVLALIANQPETSASSIVRITPLISDMKGNGRTLKYTASSCIDPGVGLGAEPTCIGSPLAVSYAVDQTVTGISTKYNTGTAPFFDVVIPPAEIIFAGRNDQDKYNGVSYLVTYTIHDEINQDVIKAYKRVIVSTKTQKNGNPSVREILSDSSPMTSRPTNGVELSVQMSEPESFSFKKTSDGVYTGDDSKTEEFTLTWMSNDGKFKRTRTEPLVTTWFDPPATTPEQGNLIFVVVLRDNRGGAAFKVVEF